MKTQNNVLFLAILATMLMMLPGCGGGSRLSGISSIVTAQTGSPGIPT
jgi:hypothetical protein